MRYPIVLLCLIVCYSIAAVEFTTTGKDIAQTVTFNQAKESERLDVFVMGDSITAGNMAYGSSLFETTMRVRNREQVGWALDTSKMPNDVESLFERLGKTYPVRFTNAAWSGAYVDKASPVDRTAANAAGGIQNFSDQLARLHKLKEKPNLVLIAPFHNNIDFVFDIESVKDKDGKPILNRATHLQEIPKAIADQYFIELSKILSEHTDADPRQAIVVLGNLNLRSCFAARAEARKEHEKNKKAFPNFEAADKSFPSTLPDTENNKNQMDMLDLAARVDKALQDTIEKLNQQIKDTKKEDQLLVIYSTAFADVDLSEIKNLHPIDGFHPSQIGHDHIAATVYNSLGPALKFLGSGR